MEMCFQLNNHHTVVPFLIMLFWKINICGIPMTHTHTQFKDFCTLFSLEVNFPVWRFWASALSRVSQTNKSVTIQRAAQRRCSKLLMLLGGSISRRLTLSDLWPAGADWGILHSAYSPTLAKSHTWARARCSDRAATFVCLFCLFVSTWASDTYLHD